MQFMQLHRLTLNMHINTYRGLSFVVFPTAWIGRGVRKLGSGMYLSLIEKRCLLVREREVVDSWSLLHLIDAL